ncbi:MAG: Rrf2 family transcriptional regulator [Terriglobales bacterium]
MVLAAMQITRAADYAVRVMVHLASLPPGSKARRRDIAEATDVPESFLSKVLQQLVQEGMIASQRGSGGGFRLAASPNVSLLDVMEAIEGPTRLNVCLEPGLSCERKSWCAAHVVWVEAQAALEHVLRSATIAMLAKQCNENLVSQDRAKKMGLSGPPASKQAPVQPGPEH